ncbi:MAG: hypothetical protein FWH33_10425 [Oscillospiraceae bacterium]|nr:hypothetical protein [Oscillospiraceae bacterium]
MECITDFARAAEALKSEVTNMAINDSEDKKVMELFSLLAQTASTLAKRDILTQNSGNERFKFFLDCLLNPFLITGISAKKISKDVDKPQTREFASFLELMRYIFDNNTGSDEVIANIVGFLAEQESELRAFYVSIITKSARIGCDVKSINKAFGEEFIPQWEVQQAYNIDKSPLKENEWFSLTEKLNGVRGTFFEGKIISRQGKEFAGLEHITGDIGRLLEDSEKWVLDGELIRNNSEGLSDNENFRIGTGLLSQDDADKRSIRLVVFDVLPKDEFVAGESALTYKDRLPALREMGAKAAVLGLEHVGVVENLYVGNDAATIDSCLDRMVAEDKEGLMLNRDSKYYRKRHNGILKVKRFYTVDLKVLSVEEGAGRLAGRLGAFVVDYKGNTLNVGSGMSDEQRDEFWRNRDELAGRVIEVKYKEESSDKKTGLLSLQFPIFVSLREEGKEESYF